MSARAKAVYSVIWYAGLGVLIYFVHNSIIRIAALFVIVFLTFGAFKIVSNMKARGEECEGEKKLAFFQLFLAVCVFCLYFYLRHMGA